MNTPYNHIFKTPASNTPLTLEQHFWQMVNKTLSDRVLSVPTVRKATKIVIVALQKTTRILNGLLQTTKKQYPELLFNTALMKDQTRYDRPLDAISRLAVMPRVELTEEQRANCDKQHEWYRKAQRESVFPPAVSTDKEKIAKAAYEADRKTTERLKRMVENETTKTEEKITSVIATSKKSKSKKA